MHCSNGTQRVTFSGPCCNVQHTPGGSPFTQSRVPSMVVMHLEFVLIGSAVVTRVVVVEVVVIVVVVTVVVVVSCVVVVTVVVVPGVIVVVSANTVVISSG